MLHHFQKLDRQFIIAILFLIIYSPMIWYVLVRFGDKIEILTLIMGNITGFISAVGAVYLGSAIANKKGDNPSPAVNVENADSVTTSSNQNQ